jgi:hypothetical protein
MRPFQVTKIDDVILVMFTLKDGMSIDPSNGSSMLFFMNTGPLPR